MSLAYIRGYYGVDVGLGDRVVADGHPGIVVGTEGQYLRVLIDGESSESIWHPTWRMEYVPASGSSDGGTDR